VAGPAKPAIRGQAIIIYCTGLGAVTPEVTLGSPAPGSPLSQTVSPVTVEVGGKAAQVFFSGLSPGFTGLYQVNALVPADAATGDTVNLSIATGGQTSNVVTIAVRLRNAMEVMSCPTSSPVRRLTKGSVAAGLGVAGTLEEITAEGTRGLTDAQKLRGSLRDERIWRSRRDALCLSDVPQVPEQRDNHHEGNKAQNDSGERRKVRCIRLGHALSIAASCSQTGRC